MIEGMSNSSMAKQGGDQSCPVNVLDVPDSMLINLKGRCERHIWKGKKDGANRSTDTEEC